MRLLVAFSLFATSCPSARAAELSAVERRAMNEAFRLIWPGGPAAVRETLVDQLALDPGKEHSDVVERQIDANATRVVELIKLGLENRRGGLPALSVTNLRELVQTIVRTHQLTADSTFNEANQATAVGGIAVCVGASCTMVAGIFAAVASAPIALPLVAASSVAWGVSSTTGALYGIAGDDAEVGRKFPVVPGSKRLAKWLGINTRSKDFWRRVAMGLESEPAWRRLGAKSSDEPEMIFAHVLTLLDKMAPPFLLNNACTTLLEQTLPPAARAIRTQKTGT